MIVRCGLLKKHDGLTRERFSDHWLNVHGPIAAGMTHLRGYYQNLVVGEDRLYPVASGGVDLDGYSELHFETYATMLEGIQSLDAATGNALLDDAEILLDRRLCDILVLSRSVVRETPAYMPAEGLLRYSVFFGRADDVDDAAFHRAWGYAHARLIDLAPGLAGYRQNSVLDRSVGGAPALHGQLPCDGFEELFFESEAAFTCFRESEEFQRAAEHAAKFTGTIDTYRIEMHPVVG